MATRYWVGGTGNWDTTTTHWSTTSGGSSGASVPTSADDVVFDTLSNATGYTVTLTPAAWFTASVAGTVMTVTAVTNGTLAVGQNIDIFGQLPTSISISSLGTGTGGVGTYNINVSRTINSQNMSANSPVCNNCTVAAPLTGAISLTSAAGTYWDIYGNFILPATNCTVNLNINPNFIPSTAATFTTNSVTLNTIQLFGTGSLSFGSAADIYAIYMFTSGFVTNNYSLTCRVVSSQQSNANIIVSLGSSTVNMYSNSGFGVVAGNVLNAGTSTINFSGSTPSVGGFGTSPVFTYYNVNFTNTSASSVVVYGTNTFNNFSVSTVTTANSLSYLYFPSNQTINGTLTMSGASYTQRLQVYNGYTATGLNGFNTVLTVNAVSALSYIDFGGITVAGASAPWSGTSIGDLQGNVNITVTAAKNVYWNYPNALGNWGITAPFATSSGGTTAVANFPLAQDTVIFDNTGLGTTGTVTYDRNWALGRLNFTSVTNPATFNMGSYPAFYLDVIFSSSLTLQQTGGTIALFYNKGTQTLVSAGLTFPQGIGTGFSNLSSSTLTLSGAASSSATFTHNIGTLNLASNTLTIQNFTSTNSNTRSIVFGTGQIYVTGNNGFTINFDIMTGFTYTGTGVFNWTYSGSVGTRGCSLGNSGGGTESNALTVNITAGTDLVQIYGSGLKNVNFTGFSGPLGDAGYLYLYGDLTFSSAMSFSGTVKSLFFQSSGVQNITSNGRAFPLVLNFQGTGTYNLLDAFTTTYYFYHYTGTLNLNNFTLTAGSGNSNAVTTRAINFGTGSINLNGNNQAIFNANNTTGLTVTGSATINFTYSGSVGTRNYLGYALGSALFNINVTAGSDIVSTTNYGVNNLNFTGFTGSTAGFSLVGSLTLGAGMTISTATGSTLGGSGTITTNGVLFDSPLTVSTFGTYTLQDALTVGSTRTFTLSQGTLDLNNKNLTCGLFNSNNTNTRVITFGTGGIYVTGSAGNVWLIVTANLTHTGAPNIYLTYNGSVGTRSLSGGSDIERYNFYITAGTDIVNFTINSYYGTLDFTGFGGTLFALTGALNLNGDLTLSSSMTFPASSGSIQFTNSNNRNITTNGTTINTFVVLSGGTMTFQSAVTIGSAYWISFYGGTLNLNNYNFTTSAIFTSIPVTIAFGTGTTTLTGSGTVFNTNNVTISASGTGKISLTSASGKVFNGGGGSFPTISQDGAGILYINGNNTYQDMTATVFPSTIDFGAGGTHSFYNFSVVGTAGNLVTVNSFVPGTTVNFVNLSGHNLGGNYMYLQDIHATPANTWYGGRNTTNVSNNTGWVFYNYYPVTVVENSTLADVKTNTAKFNASVIEALVNSDSDNLGQASYHVATSEPTTISSAITASAKINSAIVESLTALSAQVGNAKFVVSRTENSTLGDSETNLKKLYSAIIESATVANSQTSIAKYQRSVVENFYPQSTQSNLAQFKSTVVETIVVFDSSIGRGWFNIPDGQTPNWTNINDYQ